MEFIVEKGKAIKILQRGDKGPNPKPSEANGKTPIDFLALDQALNSEELKPKL